MPSERVRVRLFAARLSAAVGVGMLALKWTAYLLTSSTAILSDALESVVHVGAVLFMWFCTRVAAQPPDDDHPYGHGRIEFFSVAFEGGMVALAGLGICWQAVRVLWFGGQVEQVGIGLGLTAVAAAINLALGWYLLRTGRRTDSPILIADGHHVLSDVWTSTGVIVGVGLVAVTGWQLIDPLCALVLAGYILFTGVRLVRTAASGLMDEADPAALARVVAAINEVREPEWLDVHNLRLRVNGDATYIDFHLELPGDWSVAHAHDTIERLEAHILMRLGRQGAVMIHIDYPKDDTPTTPIPALTVAEATRVKGLEASAPLLAPD